MNKRMNKPTRGRIYGSDNAPTQSHPKTVNLGKIKVCVELWVPRDAAAGRCWRQTGSLVIQTCELLKGDQAFSCLPPPSWGA